MVHTYDDCILVFLGIEYLITSIDLDKPILSFLPQLLTFAYSSPRFFSSGIFVSSTSHFTPVYLSRSNDFLFHSAQWPRHGGRDLLLFFGYWNTMLDYCFVSNICITENRLTSTIFVNFDRLDIFYIYVCGWSVTVIRIRTVPAVSARYVTKTTTMDDELSRYSGSRFLFHSSWTIQIFESSKAEIRVSRHQQFVQVWIAAERTLLGL
jgi:hypothetical protein